MAETTNRGPVAPKDPTRKRPFFYVLEDKEISDRGERGIFG